jgi:hypothetical protein
LEKLGLHARAMIPASIEPVSFTMSAPAGQRAGLRSHWRPLDPKPLPLNYQHAEETGLYFAGHYNLRGRTPKPQHRRLPGEIALGSGAQRSNDQGSPNSVRSPLLGQNEDRPQIPPHENSQLRRADFEIDVSCR